MPDENKKIEEPLEVEESPVEKERKEYLAGWQRAKADLENYRKGEAERLKEFSLFQLEALIREILPVLDSLRLGLENAKDEEAKRGLEIIQGQFGEVLRRTGLEIIDASPGEEFDPTQEEAIGEIPSTEPPGRIAKSVALGYRFQNKVIRPVRVFISKGSEK